MRALSSLTRQIPIVYAGLFNPQAADIHPKDPDSYYFRQDGNDNVTGFVSHDFNVCQQWPIFLKRIAPALTHAAVIYEDDAPGSRRQFQRIQAHPNHLLISGIDIAKITSSNELDNAVQAAIKTAPNAAWGLIVTTGAQTASIVDDIVQIADNRNLPATYPNRLYAKRGGLISYGADLLNLYSQAGIYLGRILNGATLPDHTRLPAVLPKSDGSNFELAINRSTATRLGNKISAGNLAALLAEASWVYP
jgi:putative ABC transport system substrate-binding protein